MNTGSALPMPKMNSASGIHAIPEIGRSISNVGSTMRSKRRMQTHRESQRNGQRAGDGDADDHAAEADAGVLEEFEVAREPDRGLEHRER